MRNGLDMLLGCYLYDTMDPGTTLATAKVFRTLPRHVTPLTLETVFNSSVRLQPNHQYGISVSFPQRAHFMSGITQFASNFNFLFASNCHFLLIFFLLRKHGVKSLIYILPRSSHLFFSIRY